MQQREAHCVSLLLRLVQPKDYRAPWNVRGRDGRSCLCERGLNFSSARKVPLMPAEMRFCACSGERVHVRSCSLATGTRAHTCFHGSDFINILACGACMSVFVMKGGRKRLDVCVWVHIMYLCALCCVIWTQSTTR